MTLVFSRIKPKLSNNVINLVGTVIKTSVYIVHCRKMNCQQCIWVSSLSLPSPNGAGFMVSSLLVVWLNGWLVGWFAYSQYNGKIMGRFSYNFQHRLYMKQGTFRNTWGIMFHVGLDCCLLASIGDVGEREEIVIAKRSIGINNIPLP